MKEILIVGKTCGLKQQCTKLPKRIIHRSEYQDAVDINDNNIKQKIVCAVKTGLSKVFTDKMGYCFFWKLHRLSL
ncbi:MAG: hypothetical protein IPI78_11425 [Chitinophagaceae bacterium]|nr:hypothetical protein [Chitinophagaceae bacterium]